MKKILLINDERIGVYDILFYIENSLSIVNKITIARNCSEAIVLFRQNVYDLIILDLNLPVGDYEIAKDIVKDDPSSRFGLQLLQFFRAENRFVKIIGFSIADSDQVWQAFSDANASFLNSTSDNAFMELIQTIKSELE